jgi:hypothetical protein
MIKARTIKTDLIYRSSVRRKYLETEQVKETLARDVEEKLLPPDSLYEQGRIC